MFERFTSTAREVVVAAQVTARELGHHEIGDQHLLLALLESGGTASTVLHAAGATPQALRAAVVRGADHDAEALAALGIDLDEVRRRADETFGPGALDRPSRGPRGRLARFTGDGHLPFTRDAKRVLENALRATRELDHREIGSGHLLLGVLAAEDSPGVRALRTSGVALDLASAQAAVREELRRSA